jgi:hypothetical protein
MSVVEIRQFFQNYPQVTYSRYNTKLGIFFGEAADKNLGDSEVGKGEGEG